MNLAQGFSVTSCCMRTDTCPVLCDASPAPSRSSAANRCRSNLRDTRILKDTFETLQEALSGSVLAALIRVSVTSRQLMQSPARRMVAPTKRVSRRLRIFRGRSFMCWRSTEHGLLTSLQKLQPSLQRLLRYTSLSNRSVLIDVTYGRNYLQRLTVACHLLRLPLIALVTYVSSTVGDCVSRNHSGHRADERIAPIRKDECGSPFRVMS